MMANNSSGARSVLYGKTIDHVLEQTVLLSDGSIVISVASPRELTAPLRQIARSRVLSRRPAPRREHADEIERRFPEDAAARRRLQPRLLLDPRSPSICPS